LKSSQIIDALGGRILKPQRGLLFTLWMLASMLAMLSAWLVTTFIYDMSGSKSWSLYFAGLYVVAVQFDFIWFCIVAVRIIKPYRHIGPDSVGRIVCVNCHYPYDESENPSRCLECGADVEATNSLLDLRYFTITVAVIYDKISILFIPFYGALGLFSFIIAVWNIVSLARTGTPL